MLVSVDYKFGIDSEKELLPILKEHFKSDLLKDPFKCSIFDFHNGNRTMYLELKSRRFNKDKYNSTIIGVNKIEHIKKENKINTKYYFCFRFTDGLFYIEYDDELFNTFTQSELYLKHRGYKEKCYNIPIDKLTEIKLKIELSSETK
jgi:hypothetical protein